MAESVRTQKVRFYTPGQYAPVTGTYLVHHGTPHRADHEATIIRAEELPPCRTCKAGVQYTVLRHVSHITHDPDFAGPAELVIAKTKSAAFRGTKPTA